MDSIKLNEAQIEANLCKVCLHVVQFLTVCEVGHNKVYNLIDGFKDLGNYIGVYFLSKKSWRLPWHEFQKLNQGSLQQQVFSYLLKEISGSKMQKTCGTPVSSVTGYLGTIR